MQIDKLTIRQAEKYNDYQTNRKVKGKSLPDKNNSSLINFTGEVNRDIYFVISFIRCYYQVILHQT